MHAAVLVLSKTVYSVPFPTVFTDFLQKLSFLQFELFKLVPLQCVVPYSFYDVLSATCLAALVMVLPPWLRVVQEYGLLPSCCERRLRRSGLVGGLCLRCCKRRQSTTARIEHRRLRRFERYFGVRLSKSVQDYVLKFLLVATYLVYPTVSAMLFQTFSCEKVHLGRFLHKDYAIDCDSAEHKGYQALAVIAILVFACGVPLLFWALLYYQRHNLMHENAQYLGFFFGDYKPQHWYWEVRKRCM